MQGKYLITTDNWFYAPNGKQYKAAWGDVQIIEDTFLGLKTNRNSSNWFAKVGSEQKHIVIAGCQITTEQVIDDLRTRGFRVNRIHRLNRFEIHWD